LGNAELPADFSSEHIHNLYVTRRRGHPADVGSSPAIYLRANPVVLAHHDLANGKWFDIKT
jgi:hypothetical protein